MKISQKAWPAGLNEWFLFVIGDEMLAGAGTQQLPPPFQVRLLGETGSLPVTLGIVDSGLKGRVNRLCKEAVSRPARS